MDLRSSAAVEGPLDLGLAVPIITDMSSEAAPAAGVPSSGSALGGTSSVNQMGSELPGKPQLEQATGLEAAECALTGLPDQAPQETPASAQVVDPTTSSVKAVVPAKVSTESGLVQA